MIFVVLWIYTTKHDNRINISSQLCSQMDLTRFHYVKRITTRESHSSEEIYAEITLRNGPFRSTSQSAVSFPYCGFKVANICLTYPLLCWGKILTSTVLSKNCAVCVSNVFTGTKPFFSHFSLYMVHHRRQYLTILIYLSNVDSMYIVVQSSQHLTNWSFSLQRAKFGQQQS